MSKIYGENLGLSSSVIMVGNIIFMVTALYLYKNKNVDLVAMVVPMIIFMSSFGPVSALSNLANNLLTTFACGKRVINLLEEEPMVESNSRGKNIEFNDLSVEGISFFL